MLQKLKKAIPKHAEYAAALKELKNGLKVHANDLKLWKAQVMDWKKDQSQSNLYERKGKDILPHALKCSCHSSCHACCCLASTCQRKGQ